MTEKRHARGKVAAGDLTQRVGVEAIEARGVNVEELIDKHIDAAGAEFTTYDYYTILRMNLAGKEDYKEICEDPRLEDRSPFALITPRIYKLGGQLPADPWKYIQLPRIARVPQSTRIKEAVMGLDHV